MGRAGVFHVKLSLGVSRETDYIDEPPAQLLYKSL